MKTGWQQIYGKYYWLGHSNDGAMKTGWQKVYGKYYWLGHSNDGAMKTGWQTIYGKKYYLGGANDGAMKTGWQKIGDYWYYFGGADDGSLKTNTWIGNYHVDASGKWDKSKNQETIKYLGDEIKAYDMGYWCKEIDGESEYDFFNLGGLPYRKGFTLGTSNGSGYIKYNLEGKYNYLSGVVGNVDGRDNNTTYVVIGDEKLIGTIDVKEDELPIEFTFKISGVKNLTIIADSEYNDGENGFGNVVVYKNKTDKPNLFETGTLLSKAYLGKDIKSYKNSYGYDEFDGDESKRDNFFKLGGVSYQKGITMRQDKYANYNLEGKYNYLSGVAGNTDGQNCSATISIIGDKKLLGKINVKGGGLPVSFEVNVSGVKRLKIETSGNSSFTVGLGNLVAYKNKADKPQVFEPVSLPSTGYLGSDILPYTSSDYKGHDLSLSFKMGGVAYRKGFTLKSNNESRANFNIDGRYNYISGVAGNVDGNNGSVTYSVIGDGKLLGTITIKSGSSPKPFQFNITNVKQLNFVLNSQSSGSGSCLNGFGNVMVYSGSKPKTLSIEEASDDFKVYEEGSEETKSEEIQNEDESVQDESGEESSDSEEPDNQPVVDETITDDTTEKDIETPDTDLDEKQSDTDTDLDTEQPDTNQNEQEKEDVEGDN